MEKEYRGTPVSSNIKLHNKIGNIETNPILISKRLFENADEFFFTARIILQSKPTYLSSAFTNLSFACELYFKSIIFESKKNGTAIKEHKLDKLFKLLPSEKQNEIKDNFQFQYEKNHDFDLFLQEVADTFVFARYLHERKRACFSLELFNLVYVVRNCAKSFYNSQIRKNNNLELIKFESLKKEYLEPELKVWIYYDWNYNHQISAIANEIINKLTTSLKKDILEYHYIEKNEDWVNEYGIEMRFSRQGYMYSDEYDDIVNVSTKVFNEHGISHKGIRTNGYQIHLHKEIE